MIIDFHTHIFPDKIAKKTIDYLAVKSSISPFSDGSVDGLLAEMERGGVDVSVALPVVTNPAQFDSVNRFAADINTRFDNASKSIISFAGIHPECDDIEKKMEYISNAGFKGVKIHPDYQSTYITDDAYIKIFECAKELGLIVITHSGVDGGYRDCPVRCTPEMVRKVISRVPDVKLVLAHYGANEMFEDVFDMLCGENVYFDTAFVLRYVGAETFLKILQKHGSDRILFATDSPWSGMREDIEIIRSFGLDKETEQKIFCDNARALLGI